jgi:GTP-binding protein
MFKNIQFLKSVYKIKDLPPPELPEIAFLGRSNVGKSSLINAFLNRKKIARVSSTPGFTKALNFFRIDHKFFLVDLPGYGFAKVPPKVLKAWKMLIEGYLTAVRDFRLLILIFDIRRSPDKMDKSLILFVKHIQKPYCIVLNKIDTISKKDINQQKEIWQQSLSLPKDIPIFLTSCKTKKGIQEFQKYVISLL